MRRVGLVAVGLLVSLLTSPLFAQGVLIVVNPPQPAPLPRPWPPRVTPPPISYKIKELTYQAKVKDQIAQVQVSQTFVNTGSQQMQAEFCFPIPYDGAIDRMTFLVDGKEYDAKLLEAKKAREIYEQHVRRCQDPALLEWVGHGMFKTSVFPIPPGAERKVTLKYSQLLRKSQKLTDLLVPLSTAKYTSAALEKLSVEVAIETTNELKSVYSPTHAIEVKRPDSKHAVVKYEVTNQVPANDFRLLFDTSDGKLGASIISYRPSTDDEGFYLLLASPEITSENAERPKKTVVLVLDRSGSMSGKKIEQAKEAAKHVVNNLREGDTFNLVAYDSTVESFKPELQKYDDDTRQAALAFIDGLYAGGSTNIDGAMTTALEMIQDKERPSFVLFLTDGLPTTGETNEAKIVANAKQRNEQRARVVVFGVGYDVNSRLLDRLARELYGNSEYVRPDENIENAVSKLYNRMSSPVMTDVAVKLEVDSAEGSGSVVSRVYPKDVYDLFAGEQLVQVGRYKQHGDGKVTISGKVSGEEKKFDFPAKLVEKSNDQTYAFIEKLWALRRVGEIIDELDLKGKNEELVKELVELATKHGILTPYTSFLADETSTVRELADVSGNAARASERLERLSELEGIPGIAQRIEKKALREAYHAPPASLPAPSAPAADAASLAGRAAGRGGLTAGAAISGRYSAGAAPSNSYRDIDSDTVVVVDAVQNVGNETLYKRGKMWVATSAKDVDPEKEQDQIQKVKRFSDEYFKLVKANTSHENSILARQQGDEQLLVKLRGQVYLIE